MTTKPTAEEALQKTERPEIKVRADQSIKGRQVEIKLNADWKAKWLE